MPKSVISAPPMSGPTAVDTAIVDPNRPNALPRSSPRNRLWMRPEICGLIRPPANPWTTRITTSTSAVGASAEATLVTTNRATPTMNTGRRPCVSPKRPAGASSSPSESA
jgi:hypothetical protein